MRGNRDFFLSPFLPPLLPSRKEWQAAWLLHAVTCTDLTTLDGDDTPSNVTRLCHKARNPVRQDMVAQLGMGAEEVTVGAVCVYSARVPDAMRAMKELDCKVSRLSAQPSS